MSNDIQVLVEALADAQRALLEPSIEDLVEAATAAERERCIRRVKELYENIDGLFHADDIPKQVEAAIRKGENPQVKIARTELYFEGETHELHKKENDEPAT
jgi:hypothetical protein